MPQPSTQKPPAPETQQSGGCWAIAVGIAVILLVVSSWINNFRNTRQTRQTATVNAQLLAASETAVALIPTETPLPTPTLYPRSIIDSKGMQLALVSGGKFWMGDSADDALADCQQYRVDCDQSWFENQEPVHNVYISAFYMDIYEVTNAAYDACVQEGGCTLPHGATASYTREDYYENPIYAGYPVIMVDWFQAEDYCTWRGARLPTEAEWEKAARGWLDGMAFPWGDDTPTCEAGAVNGMQFMACKPDDTVQVGTFAPNGYGLYDMAGNVWEWVADMYDEDYYRSYPADNWPEEPTGPERAPLHVVRGGGMLNDAYFAGVAFRAYMAPSLYKAGVGFRCVVDP